MCELRLDLPNVRILNKKEGSQENDDQSHLKNGETQHMISLRSYLVVIRAITLKKQKKTLVASLR